MLRCSLCLILAGVSAALQTQYQANGGVLYRENFLSPADFGVVQRECRSLRGQMRAEKDSIARRRLGVCIDRKSETHAKLMSTDIAAKLARLTGVEHLEPSEFPAELRHYGDGSMMDWHQDDVLYD